MNAESLIKDFAANLREIASRTEFTRISCVELVVGEGFGILAGDIEEAFERFWSDPGNVSADEKLFEAVTTVRLVKSGDTFSPPGRGDTQTAMGWEILVMNIHGK